MSALSGCFPTWSSVMLGPEPSIHTAPTSSRGMDPRLKAEDDGDWGCVPVKQATLEHAKLRIATFRHGPLTGRQG
ncbi:hypothetical protein CO651_19210 [Rhizobium phaseoli]|nr:hypothetical protein CO651_19210 [Rhizobium phaseoli]